MTGPSSPTASPSLPTFPRLPAKSVDAAAVPGHVVLWGRGIGCTDPVPARSARLGLMWAYARRVNITMLLTKDCICSLDLLHDYSVHYATIAP